MSFFIQKDPKVFTEPHGSVNWPLFTPETSPVAGAVSADATYLNNEYPGYGLHDDNEGFFVYAGSGMVEVGDEEQHVTAGTCFFAPAGVKHRIKKDADCDALRIFLFHWPAQV